MKFDFHKYAVLRLEASVLKCLVRSGGKIVVVLNGNNDTLDTMITSLTSLALLSNI